MSAELNPQKNPEGQILYGEVQKLNEISAALDFSPRALANDTKELAKGHKDQLLMGAAIAGITLLASTDPVKAKELADKLKQGSFEFEAGKRAAAAAIGAAIAVIKEWGEDPQNFLKGRKFAETVGNAAAGAVIGFTVSDVRELLNASSITLTPEQFKILLIELGSSLASGGLILTTTEKLKGLVKGKVTGATGTVTGIPERIRQSHQNQEAIFGARQVLKGKILPGDNSLGLNKKGINAVRGLISEYRSASGQRKNEIENELANILSQ